MPALLEDLHTGIRTHSVHRSDALRRCIFCRAAGRDIGADRVIGRLQLLPVYESRLAAALENHLQKLFYFPRDLGLDRLRRFFSSGVSVSSTERARQISRFTATKSRLNSR